MTLLWGFYRCKKKKKKLPTLEEWERIRKNSALSQCNEVCKFLVRFVNFFYNKQ